MTEMLFRLMNFNETSSIAMSENGSDYRTTLNFNVGNDDRLPSNTLPSINLMSGRSSSRSQSIPRYEEIKLAFDQADVQKKTVIYVRMNSIYLVINDCVKNEPTDLIDL